jgi:hypothetical protein
MLQQYPGQPTSKISFHPINRTNTSRKEAGSLRWLDSQPDRSIVYVPFGSLATLDQRQFEELALGLELTGRPFLWVVCPDFMTSGLSKAWFDEIEGRVAARGMVVSWCSNRRCQASCALFERLWYQIGATQPPVHAARSGGAP